MDSLWFYLIAGMLAIYVILDGFDFGVGVLHLLVARTPRERSVSLGSIAPLWDGNEVWLVAAGGTLVGAFPALYAATFSGFYLPFMVTLWLLVLRALTIELQHHIEDGMWRAFCDYVFSLSSLLLALVLGAALANLIRGLPLDADGRFFLPLWTDWVPWGRVGVLDFYTATVGVTAVIVLAQHGAAWLLREVDAAADLDLIGRVQRVRRPLFAASLALVLVSTGLTFWIQPRALSNLSSHPWCLAAPLLVALGFAVLGRSCTGDKMDGCRNAFAGSVLLLLGLMGSALVAIAPFAVPAANGSHGGGLTPGDLAASATTLSSMLMWWVPGIAIASTYTFIMYRNRAAFRYGAPED